MRILKFTTLPAGRRNHTKQWTAVAVLDNGQSATVRGILSDDPPAQAHMEYLLERLPDVLEFSAEPQELSHGAT